LGLHLVSGRWFLNEINWTSPVGLFFNFVVRVSFFSFKRFPSPGFSFQVTQRNESGSTQSNGNANADVSPGIVYRTFRNFFSINFFQNALYK